MLTPSKRVDPWARRGLYYGLCESSDSRRWPAKAELFGRAGGHTLLIAAGTGLDFKHLPPLDVTAIEFSPAMLARARQRVTDGPARVTLVHGDAQAMPFGDHAFDTIITSCALCSIPEPLAALSEIRRTLKPGGRLLLFEHVRSRQPVLGLMLDLMTLWSRFGGTAMNRNTIAAVADVGFEIVSVKSVFLDIIVAAEARHPAWGSIRDTAPEHGRQ